MTAASFGELLISLDAEHKRQERRINDLRDENNYLKARLADLGLVGSSPDDALRPSTDMSIKMHEFSDIPPRSSVGNGCCDLDSAPSYCTQSKKVNVEDMDDDALMEESIPKEREVARHSIGESYPANIADHHFLVSNSVGTFASECVSSRSPHKGESSTDNFSSVASEGRISRTSGSGSARHSRRSNNSIISSMPGSAPKDVRPRIQFTSSVNAGTESCSSVGSFASALHDRSRRSIPGIQQIFAEDDTMRHRKSRMSRRAVSKISFETNTGNMILHSHAGTCAGLVQPFVVRPNSAKRVLWDLLSVVMVSYDVIVIPLSLLDIGTSGFMAAMDWITTCYWSLDLPFGFLTGFHREGAIEMRPKEVAWNYLKTWFLFDASVVLVDWIIIFSMIMSSSSSKDGGDASGILRFSKTGGRLQRMFRAIRLVRFFKLQRLLVEIMQLVKSEYVHTLCNVFLSILFIAVVAHYIACGWFWVGKMNDDAGTVNWLIMSDLNSNTTLYKYATSLHWSLTQFTPASMEVRPYNISERIYSICVLFFALISFSSLLGSITTAMSQLRKLQHDQTNQQIMLRRFFSDNKVSAELGQRIWKYIKKTHFTHRTRMPKEDLPLLTMLPKTLNRDLNNELYRPYLTRSPFFSACASIDSECLADVCMGCIAESSAVSGDEFFNDGQHATEIVISTFGKMSYMDGETGVPTTIKPGLWVPEPALWLQWIHLGQLSAGTSCEVMHLNVAQFRTVIKTHSASLIFAREYAKQFVTYMMSLEGEKTWKTDLFIDRLQLHHVALEAFSRLGYTGKQLASLDPKNLKRSNSISVAGTVTFFQRMKSKVVRRDSKMVNMDDVF